MPQSPVFIAPTIPQVPFWDPDTGLATTMPDPNYHVLAQLPSGPIMQTLGIDGAYILHGAPGAAISGDALRVIHDGTTHWDWAVNPGGPIANAIWNYLKRRIIRDTDGLTKLQRLIDTPPTGATILTADAPPHNWAGDEA